jgi:hypothetical protein
LVSANKGYTPLNLSDNIISDIVEPNTPDTIANIKQKSLHGRYFKDWNKQELIFRLLMHGLRNEIFILRLRVLYLQYNIVLSIQEVIKNTYAVYNRSSINV